MIFLHTLLLQPVHPGYGNDWSRLNLTDFFTHGLKWEKQPLSADLRCWLSCLCLSGEKETPHPPFFSGEKKYSSADRRDSEQRWAPWKQLDWKNVVEQFQWMHLWENKPLADANYRVAVYLFIKSNASMVPDLYFGIICILNALCAVAGCFSAAGTPC